MHTTRSPRAVVAALATTTLLAASAPAAAAAGERSLIAPLDVRVWGEVRPGTELLGRWQVSSDQGGMWDGPNISMLEQWRRGARFPIRVRGAASGGRTRVHRLDVAYLSFRTGTGILTEASPTPVPNPVQLICHAQGGTEQGQTVGTSGRVSLQLIDEPARNRVTIRGPGIPFLGPECTLGQPDPSEGQDVTDRPWRRVGLLPPDGARAWRPMGARGPWTITVPRAEFAAGGTFRFRGTYAVALPLQPYSGNDVFGTGIMSGTVVIDLRVRRSSRR